jgi:hypothetical protein
MQPWVKGFIMYYLTVKKNGEVIVSKQAFHDYAEAVAFTSQFYRPRSIRSVLRFASEAINGEFVRSYATLIKPENIEKDSPHYRERFHAAVKKVNAFDFDGSYLFVIQSEVGMSDAEAMRTVFEEVE